MKIVSPMILNKTMSIIQKSWLKDLLLLILLLIVLFSIFLGRSALHNPDEGRYSEVAYEMILHNNYITPHVNGVVFLDKPPLMYWLEAASIHIFGVHAWAFRLPAMLMALLGCLFVYIATRILYDRKAAWFSAIILATSLLYFSLAHYVNMDMGITVLLSNSLLAFLLASRAPPCSKSQRNWFYVAYLFSALAILTKGIMGILLPMMVIGLWILLLNRWALLKQMCIMTGFLLILIIITPWFFLVQQANSQFLYYFFIFQQFTRFIGHQFNNPGPWWFYLPIIVLGMFPWTIFLLTTFKQRLSGLWKQRQDHASELFLITWIIGIAVFFSIPTSKIISYILPIFPALAIITGRYLSRLPSLSLPCYLANQVLFLLFATIAIILAFNLSCLQLPASEPHLQPAFIMIGLLISIGGSSALYLMRRKIIKGFIVLASITSLSFWIALWAEPYLQIGYPNTQSLIKKIQPELTANTEIATYYHYFQDLPIYIGRYITVVADWDNPRLKNEDNSIGQIAWGRQFRPNSKQWLITPTTFWQRWYSPHTIITLVQQNDVTSFKQYAGNQFHVIAQSNGILAIANHE